MLSSIISIRLVALVGLGSLAGTRLPEESQDALARKAEAIKPASSELRWRQIPWLTDLGEGQRLAKLEHRPIFLWVTGDDPLERC